MITKKGLVCVHLEGQCTDILQREQTGFLPHWYWTIIFQTNRICPKLVFPRFNTAYILLAEHQSEYSTLNKCLVLLKRIWTLSPVWTVWGRGPCRRFTHVALQGKSLITSLPSCAGPHADVICACLVTDFSQTKSMSVWSMVICEHERISCQGEGEKGRCRISGQRRVFLALHRNVFMRIVTLVVFEYRVVCVECLPQNKTDFYQRWPWRTSVSYSVDRSR